jgi:hypothetical protein
LISGIVPVSLQHRLLAVLSPGMTPPEPPMP